MRRLGLLVLLASAAGCMGAQDNPTSVHDLRVLGLSFEPPELFAPMCPFSPAGVAASTRAWSRPVTFTALIADPQGAGRRIEYDLTACANRGDRTCTTYLHDSKRFSSGTTGPGELAIGDVPSTTNPDVRLPFTPGATVLDDGDPLLQEAQRQDTYQGLGGILLPVVLRVKAGEEEIYATKYLVFNCPFVPGMAVNNTPRVPGLTLDGEAWDEGATPQLQGPGPFIIQPLDFSDRLEEYVVPSYALESGEGLKPYDLVEAWRISWRADLGRFSESVTGGTTYDGLALAKHRNQWAPAPGDTEGDVTFWAVVRDGRGGESWLVRKAHWRP